MEVVGKGFITARVIADSVAENTGIRITTFELEYPRFIHSEFMTHRLFSRNAASSRAIPVEKMIKLIKEKTAMPIHWGKNQPGMSAKEECTNNIDVFVSDLDGNVPVSVSAVDGWEISRNKAIAMAEAFHYAGYHKQIVNRLLEPYTFIKVVCTATEYDNFFYLRAHPDAQPEIQELAQVMLNVRNASTPNVLKEGDWHVPYFGDGFWSPDMKTPKEDALAISSSCCAQVSYRILNDSIEKARDIFKKLVESKPAHSSPFEHQASPMGDSTTLMDEGVTHRTNDYRLQNLWSGNLRGWIQHRQLIPDNACWKFTVDQ